MPCSASLSALTLCSTNLARVLAHLWLACHAALWPLVDHVGNTHVAVIEAVDWHDLVALLGCFDRSVDAWVVMQAQVVCGTR